MATVGVARVRVRQILQAVHDQLVEFGGFEETSVRVVRRGRRNKVAYQLPGPDLLIHAGGLITDQASVEGSGRLGSYIVRRIGVTIRSRSDLDDPGSDMQRLLDEAQGHYDYEDEVANALHMFQPTDSQGNNLLKEPMRLLPSSDVIDDPQDSSWTWSTVEFEAAYIDLFDLGNSQNFV